MRRYLLVLDRELISTGEQSRPEAISYNARRQEREPCEVTVLSLLTTRQPQVPPFMALLCRRQDREISQGAAAGSGHPGG